MSHAFQRLSRIGVHASAFTLRGAMALGVGTGMLATVAALPAPATAAETITLGMAYVVPDHAPGAKVRTPEGLAPLLAAHLSRELPLRMVEAMPEPGAGVKPLAEARPDALLISVAGGQGNDGSVVIPTGHRAGIMGIMRTDTDIRRWEDLRGRKVCLAEDSGLAGQMRARYGAIEKVFRAPADALLDLRIGGCDAAVHDSAMLQALLEFPEWKKFSARLPVQRERDLAFVLRSDDPTLAQTLQSSVQQWREAGLLAKLTRQSAQDIAFEVYMDQEVPDCH